MPIYMREKNSGLGDLARFLVTSPAYLQAGRQAGQQRAYDRAQDAASMSKSLADARKTNLEADMLENQSLYQSQLGDSLDVLNAHQTGRQRLVPPPAPGSAASPLEGSINDSIRGNQDLFASTAVPSAGDASRSLANIILGFGGNAEQVTGAMGNVQDQGYQHQAAGAALGGDNQQAATLNAIASGSAVPDLYSTNASGTVLDVYGGGLNESGNLAQASIGAEQALADQRRQPSEASLTPQEKQYQALQELNRALAADGMPTMSEVEMRAIAADTVESRQDPITLQTMVYDIARRKMIGSFDPKAGYVPYAPPVPKQEGPGLWDSFMGLFGGEEPAPVETPQAAPAPAGNPGAPPFAGALWSPVRQEWVSQDDINATAQQRNMDPQQVMQMLGIQ